jgi:hypothetical protein
MTDIYVDADACPVKDEVYRVAGRYGLKVYLVSNAPLRVPLHVAAERIVVGDAPDAADDWIAERAAAGDVVVTNDIPLAARSIRKGARVVAPNGRVFTEASIGNALATRDLMTHLRDTGTVTGGGPPPLKPADRSRFLSALDQAIVAAQRSAGR